MFSLVFGSQPGFLRYPCRFQTICIPHAVYSGYPEGTIWGVFSCQEGVRVGDSTEKWGEGVHVDILWACSVPVKEWWGLDEGNNMYCAGEARLGQRGGGGRWGSRDRSTPDNGG
jgi:hypothetical protein